MKYKDQKTTIFSEIASIIEEGDNGTPYDLIDFMIEIMTKDQLNQVEDMITNHYPKED
jgi:hypothetical protein|tara:strand:- start:416 stop:589 length:174 start_codon:yes stop_codon:yes gene_type:complete